MNKDSFERNHIFFKRNNPNRKKLEKEETVVDSTISDFQNRIIEYSGNIYNNNENITYFDKSKEIQNINDNKENENTENKNKEVPNNRFLNHKRIIPEQEPDDEKETLKITENIIDT